MKKFKRIATQAIAFSSALSLTFTGLAALAPQNVSAANNSVSITGTSGADTFSWDNALVYFLLTDRFKNGNTSNDHSYNRGLNKNGTIVNISDDRATFHGGDFAGVTDAIEDGYFDNLGVNAIWISAPYEQVHGYIVGDNSNPSYAHYSYHGYYVGDYTQTDANFGTAEEFKEMVDTAHEHGIRVVIDVVLNHAGYNSIYDMNEYDFGGLKSGWENYYYAHKNITNQQYHRFVDYSTEEWRKWWGGTWVRAGLPGGYETDEESGSELTMSLTGLPDFKTESTATVGIPTFLAKKWKQEGRYDKEVTALKNFLNENKYDMTVTNCISYWLSRWVREYGVDGFRCDTAKHVEYASWATLNEMCTEALKEWKAENPDKKLDDLDFWMTGEAWGHTVSYDGYYTEANFDSMINFEVSGGNGLDINSINGKYSQYASNINTKDDFNVLSYISSHDSTLARTNDMIYTGSAFLLLPGGVQIYYGDETNRPYVNDVNSDGNGGAGHSLRSDMNWDSMDENLLAHWQKVGSFRSNHIAVGAGSHNEVSASSGVGFTRTYSKNGITDRVAACIGASKNTAVTIDVSGVWNDGEEVMNCYNDTTAVVTNGKVTFNSGANGTILISDIEENGKPRVNINGNSSFVGTQKVTISVKNADYALVSVDGANKIKAYDGDQITIGATAYEGDTVKVTYKAVNEEGITTGSASFYKDYANGQPGGSVTTTSGTIIKVKMSDGSAPYLHAWNDEGNITGNWPGVKLIEKDSNGYYYTELDITGEYNIVFNNNNGWQTENIEGLTGHKVYDIDCNYNKDNDNGVKAALVEADKTIKITIAPYGSNQPNLYVWCAGETLNGAWPGDQLTEQDGNGNYVFTVEGYDYVNCIVNGQGNQSSDIGALFGDTLITVKSADYGTYELSDAPKSNAKLESLKEIIREVKNMTSTEYTTATWNALYAYVDDVDAMAALDYDELDDAAIDKLYNNVKAAREALMLALPSITSAKSGSKTITGKAACDAEVVVAIKGSKFTAVADSLTGAWSVTLDKALTASTEIMYSAAKNDVETDEGSYIVQGTAVLNGLHKASDGNYYYYVNGEVDTTYTGLCVYKGKCVYVNKGKFDATYTGLAKNAKGVWYVKNGVLDLTYTGMAKNAYGLWYIKEGKLDTTYTGLCVYKGKCIYVNKGKFDATYTGLAKNAYGLWYIKEGKLDTTYTGLCVYKGKCIYVNKGKFDATYTGLAKNAKGVWYIKNGVFDATYTGMAKNAYGLWYIKEGKFDTTYTGLCVYKGKCIYVNKGKFDSSYTGIAKNSAGWWYMKNGIFDITYNGKVEYQGVTYNVVNGKVAK